MGKLIAVWGSPDSGKTTFSVKLAEERVYESLGKTTLIFLFVYCVYRYDRRMVNNSLYHKCPIISRGRGSLNEFRQ